jgi:hypothetical protein
LLFFLNVTRSCLAWVPFYFQEKALDCLFGARSDV